LHPVSSSGSEPGNQPTDQPNKFTQGEVAGIVIGIAAAILLGIILICLCPQIVMKLCAEEKRNCQCCPSLRDCIYPNPNPNPTTNPDPNPNPPKPDEKKNEIPPVPEITCSICLANENCINCKAKCGHTFHIACISKWL
jgi:hypothetical protein